MSKQERPIVNKKAGLNIASGLMLAVTLGYTLLSGYSLYLWVTDSSNAALRHASLHLAQELKAAKVFNTAVFQMNPSIVIGDFLNKIEQFVSINGQEYLAPTLETISQSSIANFAKQSLAHGEEYIPSLSNDEMKSTFETIANLALINAEIVACKVILLFFSIPLFVAAIAIGFADGLNKRAIRKAELGRESSYVFHRLTHHVIATLMIILGGWIALPFNVNHSRVFIPASILLGVLVLQTASRFKKHI